MERGGARQAAGERGVGVDREEELGGHRRGLAGVAGVGGAEDARVDMEAINGDLRLDIIGGVNADFDIETFNGSINNDFGPEAEAVSRYTPGKSLRFTEGDGGARVRIKTLNGTISLRNR